MPDPFQTQTMAHRQHPPIYMTNLQVIPDHQQDLVHVVSRHPQFPFAAVSALTVSEATQLMMHLRLALQELDTKTLCQRAQSQEEIQNNDSQK